MLAKPKDKLVSRLGIWRQDNHLGEVRVGQFGIVGNEEARRSASEIGADNLCLGLSLQPVLDLNHGGLCRLDARTLRQCDFDNNLWPVRLGKELLPDEAHAKHRCEEDKNDGACHEEFMLHRPDNEPTQFLVIRCFVDRGVAAFHRRNIG